jgi:hypothetical protein
MAPAIPAVESGAFRWVSALLGLSLPLLWLWTFIGPAETAVKVRNALAYQMGAPADFDWLPDAPPPSFLGNRGPIPKEFVDIAARLESHDAGGMGSFDRAVSISTLLMGTKRRVGGPIQADNLTAYQAIVEQGRGYCADFTQVFQAIAVAGEVPVREWGISFHGFGAGHAFNEIYDQGLGKWVFIDSFHSLYFVDANSGQPLSVREVHDALLSIGPAREIKIQRIIPSRFPFRSEALAIDYYRRGMPQLALVWGNNVFDYEVVAPVRWAGKLSRALEQAVAISLGVFPKFRVYPIGVSDRDWRELHHVFVAFVISATSALLALIVFGAQLFQLIRLRRQPASVQTVPANG